jgi:hypothetical protein
VEKQDIVRCVECGDELPAERAGLGYRYCTKAACQAVHNRGIVVTTVGLNKGGESVIIADEDEIRRRGEAGELAKKDTTLPLDYRAGQTTPGPRRREPVQAPGRTVRRPWTAEQERAVRLYHEMGLDPRQIAERARQNTPRLGITERLATQIMSTLPRRRP